MSSKANVENDTKISKKLSYILRHGAIESRLKIQSDGFVDVQEILKIIPECTLNDLKRIVDNNDKKRFTLTKVDQILKIKANQGHSIVEVDCLNLKLLDHIPFDVIHGTYFNNYQKIKVQGLLRMKRNHIHFAKGLNFICGLRKNAEIFIYINTVTAKKDGLEFYESENGVILSAGNSNGCIEPKYFLKVIARNGKVIGH